jgi:carboxyl-terminal processing protease
VPPPARRIVGVIGLVVALGFVAGASFYAGYASARLNLPVGLPVPGGDRDPTAARTGALAVVAEAWRIVDAEFYDHARVDPAKLTYGAIKGMLETLEDPYTVVADQQRTRQQSEQIRGSFDGVGISIEVRDGRLMVTRVIGDSPAMAAGVRPGDQIVRIDDREMRDPQLAQVVDQLRGPRGSSVTLTVQRPGQPGLLRFDVTRGEIRTAPIEARMLPGDVAYVRLTTFSTTSGQDLRRELDKLLPQHPSGIVIDLRNNPGGVLQSAVDVASDFIDDGVVVYEERANAPPTARYVQRTGPVVDLPLAVLVNHGSASASEIVAGALQDRRRAVLVGEPTYGKDSIQNVHRLSDDESIRVTAAKWATPLHQSIGGRGLQPDIAVAMSDDDRRQGRDPQLERAVDYLRTRLARAP